MAAVGEGDQIGERFNVLFVVGANYKREESSEKVGDGNDLIALIGADDTGFATRVHTCGDAGEIFVPGKKKRLGDDGGSGASSYGDNLWHCLDISRIWYFYLKAFCSRLWIQMSHVKEKRGKRDVYGEERCRVSCGRVGEMFQDRPWVTGEIIETIKDSEGDRAGIDMYVPIDDQLAGLMCLHQSFNGLFIQIKSNEGKENGFLRKHKENMLNLASGENIFVINGQEDKKLMMASMVAQMVVMSSLTGSVLEEVMLGFLAENMNDSEAVQAYFENREYLIRHKWFKRWLDGSNIDKWKGSTQELLIVGR